MNNNFKIKFKNRSVFFALVLMLFCIWGCGQTNTDPGNETGNANQQNTDNQESTLEETQDADMPSEIIYGTHHAVITVKDYGTIKIELNGDVAPYSVTSFMFLAKKGFYDNLTFHRIITGFMIQGGDPLGNGTGGANYCIPGEFSSNGYENNLSHTRGAVSMARSQDPNSASSQFFIVHEDSTFLDGDYAVFGYVTEGMDVVDAICNTVQVLDNNGTVAAASQPVIDSIVITD